MKIPQHISFEDSIPESPSPISKLGRANRLKCVRRRDCARLSNWKLEQAFGTMEPPHDGGADWRQPRIRETAP